MKLKLTLLFTVIVFTAFGQTNRSVELNWKISKNENLQYATEMSELDSSSAEMDLGGLFKTLSDSTDNGAKESREFFKKINQALKDLSYTTTLSQKKEGVIDVIMASKPKEEVQDSTEGKEAEMLKMMRAMNKGVMLRGSVYETGEIHSFWVKSSQKNLIALLFQLPATPVRIGDKWSLDINFIANDQNFECDSAYNVNEVTLSDIKKVDGETIAVLNYNIIEYVEGDFHTPAMFGSEGGKKETTMKFSYQGIAEFSVDKGYWKTYNGIMSFEASGIMNADKKTKFSLVKG